MSAAGTPSRRGRGPRWSAEETANLVRAYHEVGGQNYDRPQDWVWTRVAVALNRLPNPRRQYTEGGCRQRWERLTDEQKRLEEEEEPAPEPEPAQGRSGDGGDGVERREEEGARLSGDLGMEGGEGEGEGEGARDGGNGDIGSAAEAGEVRLWLDDVPERLRGQADYYWFVTMGMGG
ncbi:hypothetical protein HYFRA_00003614 [Hymenoscyphus fraxineus]|uniref:Myb-like domain-containing protein n=1 Tax=Hymenoscyphus fraxineus TaxID=746836 RepID=A0A9N9KYM0_9HELO|nr:hypothetical protein HYFRA_00003614 [Hymenoscyphus fraxineus]